jgi:hypothetical protein
MSYGMEDRETVTRRVLVRRGVAVLSAVAAVATQAQRASGTIKISKAAVAYQDHPEGGKQCGKCLQFVSPNSCKMVDGVVSSQGFCRIFTPLKQT